MTTSSKRKPQWVFISFAASFILSGVLASCHKPLVINSPYVVSVSPVVPSDIQFADSAGTPVDSSKQAAIFAWDEFIALNWSARVGHRDSADFNIPFGANPAGIPLVWHTFRHKVEIYPGNGKPPHGDTTGAADYGYNDNFLPQYFYSPASTGTKDGQVKPFPGVQAAKKAPWINLDETNEIGLANMYAGAGDTTGGRNQMLYLAKANKAEYVYAAQTGWYGGNNLLDTARKNTIAYITKNNNTPAPNTPNLVSFPNGTIEVKTAWRRLTAAEQSSGRFYTDTVRYYLQKNGGLYYRDEVFGMVALHIIHKTPGAPFFVFATFEQTDNLLTTDGKHVEDENGNMVNNQDSAALYPNFKVVNATPTTNMMFTPLVANAVPGSSLYYKNTTGETMLPQGTVRINKRFNPIPQTIINVNKMAHDTILSYANQKHLNKPVWMYYKLINVQYKPINKPQPGVNYHGKDSANYYQANSVVESDYVLQKFSGAFGPGGTITDFKGNDTAFNAYNGKKFLMGGCMGCHGNATNGGNDYSFIFGFPVPSPAPARQITNAEAIRKFALLFPKKK